MAKRRRDILEEFEYVNLNDLAEKAGGRFKLATGLTKRVRELVKLRLMDTTSGVHPVDVTIREFKEGKISLAEEGENGTDDGKTAA